MSSSQSQRASNKALEGARLLVAGDYEGAIVACDEAMELEPSSMGARRARDKAHEGMARKKNAELNSLRIRRRTDDKKIASERDEEGSGDATDVVNIVVAAVVFGAILKIIRKRAWRIGVQSVSQIGTLGTEVEMRYAPNGNPVSTFRLAVSRSYTSDGVRKQSNEWFTVVVSNALAESCNQYLGKGKRVFVEGRLKGNEWTGQDGLPRHSNEIHASRVIFLDRADTERDAAPTTEADKDDVP